MSYVMKVHLAVLLAALACLMAAVLLHLAGIEADLVRADPNAIPARPALMEYARRSGDALYQASCTACHGVAGQGDPGRGIPDLSDADWLYGTGSVSDIEQIIRYGIRSYHPRSWNLAIMPAYATARPSARDGAITPLSPANIRDLIEFLFREQGRQADGVSAARGAALFRGAGGCYDCHAPDAKGDSAIGAPNLTDRITLYGGGSRDALRMSISYGRHGVCPSWESRLGAVEIREVALYVYSLSHPEIR
jgi:cytochrome c oxidase cbb3-type subunit 3